jgi:hypothetical protein
MNKYRQGSANPDMWICDTDAGRYSAAPSASFAIALAGREISVDQRKSHRGKETWTS